MENILAVVVTETVETSEGRKGRIVGIAGSDRGRWMHLLDEIEQDFRAEGCERVQTLARPGFVADMPDYRITGVILEKRL